MNTEKTATDLIIVALIIGILLLATCLVLAVAAITNIKSAESLTVEQITKVNLIYQNRMIIDNFQIDIKLANQWYELFVDSTGTVTKYLTY